MANHYGGSSSLCLILLVLFIFGYRVLTIFFFFHIVRVLAQDHYLLDPTVALVLMCRRTARRQDEGDRVEPGELAQR